jgi:hypothetical protein
VNTEEGGASMDRVIGFSSSQTNMDRTEDVAVDRGQCITKHLLRSGDLRIGQLNLVLHSPPADG